MAVRSERLKQLATELKHREDIEKSLRLARRRQYYMLPKLPVVPGMEFAAVYDPADNISGDFYDFFPVGEDLIGIALGDVSGHGVEAGIVMGMAKKALQIYAKGKTSAAETLTVTNADLVRDLDSGTFVSANYGVLDTRKRVFRFARAGHNPACLVNPAREPPLTLIRPEGIVINLDKDGKRFAAVLKEETLNLRSGDLLAQYTDGVVEAPDRNRAKFGEKRFHELLLQSYHLPVADMLILIEDIVQSHIGSQAQVDDITMIAFRVT